MSNSRHRQVTSISDILAMSNQLSLETMGLTKREYKNICFYYNNKLSNSNDLANLITILREMFDNKILPNSYIIYSALKILRKNGRIEDIIALYNFANDKNLLSGVVINQYIEAIQSKKPIELIEKACSDAIRTNQTSPYIYANTIKATIDAGRPDLTEKYYKEACERGNVDGFTHSIMLKSPAAMEDISYAKKIFANAVKLEHLEVVHCCQLVEIAQVKRFDIIEDVWRVASKRKLLDDILCKRIIEFAMEAGRFALANEVYDAAQATGNTSIDVYINMLKSAGANHQLTTIEKVFNDAVKVGQATHITVGTAIHFAAMESSLEVCERLYNKAIQANLTILSSTHDCVMSLANKKGRLDLVEKVYQQAKSMNQADTKLTNSYLDYAGRHKKIETAENEYENMKHSSAVDNYTFNTMLNLYGKNQQLLLAEKTYTDAIAANSADIFTHTTMLDIQGSIGSLEIARQIYDTLINNGTADTTTYNTMIKVLNRAGKYELVKEVYNSAKISGKADAFTHASVADSFVALGELDEARHAFAESKFTLQIRSNKENSYVIDLHELTYGCAYIGLYDFVKTKAEEMPNIRIVTGKGSHSKTEDKETIPLKSAVKKLLQDLKPYMTSVNVSRDNASYTLKLQYVPDVQHQHTDLPAAADTTQQQEEKLATADIAFDLLEKVNAAARILLARNISFKNENKRIQNASRLIDKGSYADSIVILEEVLSKLAELQIQTQETIVPEKPRCSSLQPSSMKISAKKAASAKAPLKAQATTTRSTEVSTTIPTSLMICTQDVQKTKLPQPVSQSLICSKIGLFAVVSISVASAVTYYCLDYMSKSVHT